MMQEALGNIGKAIDVLVSISIKYSYIMIPVYAFILYLIILSMPRKQE